MRAALLYPHFEHPAIEERYGTWQAQLFLRRAAEWAEWVTYFPDEPIGNAARGIESPYCVVVTDPLLLAPESIVSTLSAALHEDVAAALPVTNEPENEQQRASGHEPYLTIRQFEDAAADFARRGGTPRTVTWQGDPGLFLCRTEEVRVSRKPAAQALDGSAVAIVPGAYVHRWTRLRSQGRGDLLPRIPLTARNILEFGCAEGLLGEELKRRQKCRIVGIEIDQKAAAVARKRLDDVYCGDATHLVDIIEEKFDCIIGGDVLEHLDDPWSFLIRLRELALPDASLILSVPNVGNWAIVADLLRSRFDYAYIAITCAGHLRFFNRRTISDTLEIAGWRVAAVEPQAPIVNSEAKEFVARLEQAGLTSRENDLLAPGFYVVARNSE